MCKYCNNAKIMRINCYERLIVKDEINSLQLIRPINNENRFYLSYCPFCGRKLESN